MGEIVGFVSKSELERIRLIREARAIYDSIFPPGEVAGEPPASNAPKLTPTDADSPSKRNIRQVTARP